MWSPSLVSPSRRHSSIAADESLARAALKTTLLEADVSQDICGKFMDALRTKECDKGEYVIRQGDIGDTFFVIATAAVVWFYSISIYTVLSSPVPYCSVNYVLLHSVHL